MLTAGLRDLFVLDPAVMIWKDLSSLTTGEIPSSRDSIGITSVGSKIYIFGGILRKGELNLINCYSFFVLNSIFYLFCSGRVVQ